MLLPDRQRSPLRLVGQEIAGPSVIEQCETPTALGVSVQSEQDPVVPAALGHARPRSRGGPAKCSDVGRRSDRFESFRREISNLLPVIAVKRHLG